MRKISGLLHSPSLHDKKEALDLLLKSQDASFLPQVVPLMSEKDKLVAGLARRVSVYLSENTVRSGGRDLSPEVLTTAVSVIRKICPDFIKEQLSRLGDPKPEGIIEGLVAVKPFLTEAQAAEVLKRFLKHEDKKVRATAALHVGLIAARRNTNMLVQFLEDSDNRVRANTLEVLEQLGNARLTRVISRFKEDPNNRVRANALKALFSLGEENLHVELQSMLTHEKPLMRTSAVWVIGEIGGKDPSYLPLLKLVMEDTDELLWNNLIIVTKKVGDHPDLAFLRLKLSVEIKKRLKAKIIKNAKLDVERFSRDQYALFKLTGSITVDTVLPLKLKMEEVDLSKEGEVVLDFRNVEFIDSSGIAFLSNFTKKIEKANGFLFVFGLNYRLTELFQLSKIDRALRVFQTEEEVREFIF